jgi:hypothetical protein
MPTHSWDSGPACLSSPLSYVVSAALGGTFVHALGREMAEFMGDASQQRLKIREHTRRKINSPRIQAGEGKVGLMCVKSIAHFQEFRWFEDNNRHPFVGIRSVAKVVRAVALR